MDVEGKPALYEAGFFIYSLSLPQPNWGKLYGCFPPYTIVGPNIICCKMGSNKIDRN